MTNYKDFRNFDMYLEFQTVKAMLTMYCHAHHNARGLCEECSEILDYARERTKNCPHFRSKIPCSKCKIHCYQEPFKSKIRKVMIYSGPKILFRHPILALRHLLCKLRKPSI